MSARNQARALGATRYSDGTPCRRGHVAERFTANKNCVECQKLTADARLAANPEADKMRRRRWVAANRDHVIAQAKARRIEKAEELAAYGAAYRAANKDATAARHARYRIECAAQVRESKRRWKLANPEAVKNYVRTRRARIKGAECTLTAAESLAVLRAQRGRCAYCPGTDDLELDHVVPIARGGAHAKANIQWLCGPCNRRKSWRDPVVFAQAEGRLL
jgi:5-methylcytosine-specific restriction endonuclease McrA